MQVRNDNRFRPFGDGVFQVPQIQHRLTGKHIDQNRSRSHRQNVDQIGFEIIGRKDHFIPG